MGARLRHPCAVQRARRRGVPRRLRGVPEAPAAGRQPAYQARAGGRRRVQEVPAGGAGRRVGAARMRERRRHVRDTGEPPARAHRPVQVPGQGQRWRRRATRLSRAHGVCAR
uniref:Uncharacterized protein n=1 Tax=Arundo donax TaxID=35708 RepID=A0A0A9CMT2_ARUDO